MHLIRAINLVMFELIHVQHLINAHGVCVCVCIDICICKLCDKRCLTNITCMLLLEDKTKLVQEGDPNRKIKKRNSINNKKYNNQIYDMMSTINSCVCACKLVSLS